MGRAPCCDKASVKRGPWSPEEDRKLKDYIHKHGTGGNWIALPHKAELKRCGKSCRLRWLNYLRPNIKHGDFSEDEDRIICSLFAAIGSRWSIIAAQLPGRTDNDIKNYWNTKLKKKLMLAHGLQPLTVNSHHRSKKQQHLFFSAEAPSTSTPFPPGDPLSLPYLSTLDLSHHYSSESQCYDNSSTSLLMFGGNGEQQMMSSSCSDSGRGGLGLYMEFCNNGSAHGHDTAVVTAEDLAMESFVFQDDHRKAPLLLSGAANLDHFQYGANTSCGGSIKDPADSLFCSYREEKSGSSPTSAGVSQQGRFMY